MTAVPIIYGYGSDHDDDFKDDSDNESDEICEERITDDDHLCHNIKQLNNQQGARRIPETRERI